MSWLDFFQTTQTLKHTFGRGINASISKNEEELFIKSSEAFEKKDILNAYELFFESLINFTDGKANNNITYIRTDEELHFTIYQGCAKVKGKITKENLYAEAIIVKKEDANVALKRYILERNYQLTYAYYFTNNEYIMLKLYYDNITMSPQKIFFPLREIALNADYDKEHIKSEFDDIELEDVAHIKPLNKNEAQIKYNYLHKWIKEVEEKISILPSNDNASMQAFLYLNFLFKIDYLLVPNYMISQKLSKNILEYFAQDTSNIESKNEELRIFIEKLKEISFEEFNNNFYNANYTFNPTEKSSYEDIITFINESLTKIRWYKNNRYNQIIPTIYKYIAFYTLYNYGLNPVLRELFHLLVEVQNPDFFKDLDYKTLYNKETNSFKTKVILTRVDDIIKNYQARFKALESFSPELNFSSLNDFSNSFYQQIQNLNFEEI